MNTYHIWTNSSQYAHTGTDESAVLAASLKCFISHADKEYAVSRLQSGGVAMGSYGFSTYEIRRVN
jgi:hypothetical protein